MTKKLGKLWLIPTPLGDDATHTIPPYVVEAIGLLQYFVVEKAKTTRHFIKKVLPELPLSSLQIEELHEQTPITEVSKLLLPLLEGHDLGLMSEAGCPAVADPGAILVALAHQKGIEVMPLVGPNSILLALMGSGMNGQNFAFVGYLSAKRNELEKDLKKLELQARKFRQTQIFIETPYRTQNFIETALQVLSPDIRFCIAADLTTPPQYLVTKTIADWRKQPPSLQKRTAIFLIGI